MQMEGWSDGLLTENTGKRMVEDGNGDGDCEVGS